jgi:glycosyltransferase involved in cell wall biosynthesis
MGKIAYLMSRFPHLPETFILREMIELERQGWQVLLYSLIFQNQSVVHKEAKNWLVRANRFPWFSYDIFKANLRFAINHPRKYFYTLGQIFRSNFASPKFLVRALVLFPKSVKMAEKMQSEGVQHMHAHYATHPTLVAWIINRLTGINYSVTVHAHDIFVDRSMLDVKLRDAAFIVSISQYNLEFLVRHLGNWVREKTHVIHCGVQPGLYAESAGKKNSARFDIVSIGSLQPYKGMQHLVMACAMLRTREIPVYCRIVGEGDERPMLERLIAQHDLSQCVELLGARDQAAVASVLGEAQVYVQPSVITPSGKMEGIPVSIMEAFASGIPVVASQISGIPELVVPNETGYLVPPGDVKVLADALEHIYHNPAEANSLAKAGQEKVLHEFELGANVQELSLLFQQALAHQQH